MNQGYDRGGIFGTPAREMQNLTVRALLMVACACAACGDNDDGNGSGQNPTPDARPGQTDPDAPDTGDPVTIDVATGVEPALVAVRDGATAAWTAVTASAPSSYQVVVHGPYTLLVVCAPGATQQRVTERSLTPADERTQTIDCTPPPAPGAQATLSGRMTQSGLVAAGDGRDTSVADDWSFDIDLTAGTHDLVAVARTMIGFRRGIDVTNDVTLATTVNLLTEGAPYIMAPLVVPNPGTGEVLRARVTLRTATTPAAAPIQLSLGLPAGALLAPNALLVATDEQVATVSATKDGATRSRRRPVREGGDLTYALPEPLAGAAFSMDAGQLVGTWTSLPAYTSVQTRAETPRISHVHELSASFVNATAATHATIDTEVPGFDAAWKIDYTGNHKRVVSAQNVAGETVDTSELALDFLP